MVSEENLGQWSVRLAPRDVEVFEGMSHIFGGPSTTIRTALFLLWRDTMQLDRDVGLELVEAVDKITRPGADDGPSVMVNTRITNEMLDMRDQLAERLGTTYADVWRKAVLYLHYNMQPSDAANRILEMLRTVQLTV